MKQITKFRMNLQEENRKRIYDVLQLQPNAIAAVIKAHTGLSEPTVLKGMRAIKAGWKPEEQK